MADDLSAMIGFVILSNAKGLLFGAAWAGAWGRRFFALPFEAQGKLRMTTWGQNDNVGSE